MEHNHWVSNQESERNQWYRWSGQVWLQWVWLLHALHYRPGSNWRIYVWNCWTGSNRTLSSPLKVTTPILQTSDLAMYPAIHMASPEVEVMYQRGFKFCCEEVLWYSVVWVCDLFREAGMVFPIPPSMMHMQLPKILINAGCGLNFQNSSLCSLEGCNVRASNS